MARSPVGAPGATGAWLQRAGRIIGANQRLLFFPIAIQVGAALLVLPVTLASRDAITFSVYARDAADDSRVIRLLESAETATGTYIAIGVAFLGSMLLQAWLGGAFIRSIGDGNLTWWPGRRAFLRLLVLYVVGGIGILGVGALVLSDDYAAFGLPASLALSIPLFFSDYSVVLEEQSVGRAVVRSVKLWMRRPGQALLAFVAFTLVAVPVFELFIDRLKNADEVFPGFFGALLLVQALVTYVSDCTLIALLLETPDEPEDAGEPDEPEPTRPGSAPPA